MKATLPLIPELRQRCQALAALDLILSPQWEYRYFSFNCRWSPGQQMGSMRDGSGDEWFCLFHQDGWAGLKGLDHTSGAWRQAGPDISLALQRSVPPLLAEFASEPAFRWEATTFVFYSMGDAKPWTRVNDVTSFAGLDSGEKALLALLSAGPEAYVRHVEDYYEREIDPAHVAHCFAQRPVTSELVQAINDSIDLTEIAAEMFDEIGYPRYS